MQILMLGNGFDIEHKLPTQYKDFLEFAKDFLQIIGSEEKNESIAKIAISERKSFFEKVFNGEKEETRKLLEQNLKDNNWIQYFFRNQVYMRENWIDFESEISKIIILLEKAKRAYENASMFPAESIPCPKEYSIFHKEMSDPKESKNISSISGLAFSYNKKMLLNDLNRLIKALEIYLAEYVGTLDIYNYNSDIAKLNPTHVLSFNYTNTYERIYDNGCRSIQYDFIHGQAIKDNFGVSNMVLGIDEYLDEEERSKIIEFIEFQKYYQRMQKKTKCDYKEWKDQITEARKRDKCERVELYIFGHSLDSTDKDVLLEFLLNDGVTTTIFYYDQAAYERGLANLVKILGANELQAQMYGKDKTIRFVQQAPSERIENSEFDIKNDTLKIYRLAKFKDEQIASALLKIQDRIKSRELAYFCSQERVISLYDALIKWRLCSNEEAKILFDIAKKLSSTEKLLYHNSEKWHEYDYRGDCGCPTETLKFLNAVNRYNAEVFQTSACDIGQATELDIIRSYERQSNIEESLFEHILDKLIVKVGETENNGDYIWEKLCQISYNNMSVAQKVIKKKLTTCTDLVNKVRLIYLYECCEETEFFLEQEREYLEHKELYGDE